METNKNTDIWAYVVMSMLAVNHFTIHDSLGIHDGLKSNGLFDLKNLSTWSHEKIFTSLKAAGYNRTDLVVGFLTVRLMSLGSLIGNIKVNEKILTDGTEQETADLLLKIKGVGPIVLKNFLSLRDEIQKYK